MQTKRQQTAIITLKQGGDIATEVGKQTGGGDWADTGDGIQRQPQRDPPEWRWHVRSY